MYFLSLGACSADLCIAMLMSVCLSVRLSVTLVYDGQTIRFG